ncbi:MAG: hypothetical protein UR68_C0016G0013, partial [Candidatus Roizmanbacteria bacterium GW2011_GWA2_35_19]
LKCSKKRRKPTVSEEKEYFRLLGPLKVKIYQLFGLPVPIFFRLGGTAMPSSHAVRGKKW